MKASIAQWQSVGLVNQRSWVQSSLEANDFCKRRQAKYIFLVGPPPFNNFDGVGKQKSFMTPTWFEHAAFWSGVRRATVAPRSQFGNKSRSYYRAATPEWRAADRGKWRPARPLYRRDVTAPVCHVISLCKYCAGLQLTNWAQLSGKNRGKYFLSLAIWSASHQINDT